MELRVDTAADCAYIAIRAGQKVARTEPFGDSVLIDLDDDDRLVGIELLTLTADVDVCGIANRYGLPDTVRNELRSILGGESS